MCWIEWQLHVGEIGVVGVIAKSQRCLPEVNPVSSSHPRDEGPLQS